LSDVVINDRVLRKLMRKLERMGVDGVKVGVLASNATAPVEGAGITMIELAAIHELGSPRANIPARSFIRSTFQDATVKRDQAKLTSKLVGKIIKGTMAPHAALDVLGSWGVSRVRWRIKTKQIKQQLEASTIARKGSETALIDTGGLLNSITHVVAK